LTQKIAHPTMAVKQDCLRREHILHFEDGQYMSLNPSTSEEISFVEFRRKVRSAEVLSAAMERLLAALQFTGRVSVVVQNGRVLKSGYEEGYFRQRESPSI
jgi:hypothetical protein